MFNANADIFSALAAAIPEGVLIVDKQQKIITVNAATNTMFSYSDNELEGQELQLLIPKRFRAGHRPVFNAFVHEAERRQMGKGRDLFGVRKTGEEFPVEVGLSPFEVAGETYVIALLIDITERKKVEREILELNTKLEAKVRERTKELQDSIAELRSEVSLRKQAESRALESLKKERELNELKTKFLSLVSHEFKTPLSGILTSTVLVGKYRQEEQQPQREKHLELIKNKVHYLNGILNDFLSLERLESGKVNYRFSSFLLSKPLNEVIYNANVLLKSGQKINYPDNADDVTLYFDEKILELILTNLIGNAIKYSPADTTIDIRITGEEEKVILKVIDQGIGIPKEDQKYIFQRYFRAENVLNDQGTGIGLNIIKGHLDELGGTISFSSIPQKGSTFTVEIPTKLADKHEAYPID